MEGGTFRSVLIESVIESLETTKFILRLVADQRVCSAHRFALGLVCDLDIILLLVSILELKILLGLFCVMNKTWYQ
jgi:hypothetical protein